MHAVLRKYFSLQLTGPCYIGDIILPEESNCAWILCEVAPVTIANCVNRTRYALY